MQDHPIGGSHLEISSRTEGAVNGAFDQQTLSLIRLEALQTLVELLHQLAA